MTGVPGFPRMANVRHAIRRPFAAIALIGALFALVSCDAILDSPKARADADGSAGSLVISFGEPRASARTVTADFTGLVSAWTIDLSRADGATRAVTASGATVTVSGLVPGSWNLAVTGRTAAGVTLFTGSVAGVAITASGSVPVTVPVTAVSPDNGTLRLTVTVPYYSNIASATATVDPDSASSVTATVTVTVDDVALTRTLLIEASLPKGAHTLVYRLFRGAAQNTPAGTFVEAVNVYPGIVSDRWIADDGTLQTVRALDWDDLVSTDRQLRDIELSSEARFLDGRDFVPGMTYDPPGAPNALSVLIGSDPDVDLVPVEAVAGQSISYSIGSATWPGTSILSYEALLDIAPGTAVYFRVVSPNGDETWNNVYRIDVTVGYRVRYHSNGEVVANEQVFAEPFGGGPYAILPYLGTGMPEELFGGTNRVFIGWNTERNGSGLAYRPGDALTAPAHTELYAQWQKPAVTLALGAISAQLNIGMGTVFITADFTANDLYAVSDLIASKSIDVTLDFSLAALVTCIPDSAFIGCTRLMSVISLASVTSIGPQAFEGTGMVTLGTQAFDFISVSLSPPVLDPSAFGPVGAMSLNFRIFVPAASEALYEGAVGWNTFSGRIDPN